MRMWNVDPTKMCTTHILGEHYECHMFVGSITKGISMKGFFENGMLDITKLKERHEELVAEMIRRGMTHKTPLKRFTYDESAATGFVSVEESVRVLKERCPVCKKNLEE